MTTFKEFLDFPGVLGSWESDPRDMMIEMDQTLSAGGKISAAFELCFFFLLMSVAQE